MTSILWLENVGTLQHVKGIGKLKQPQWRDNSKN